MDEFLSHVGGALGAIAMSLPGILFVFLVFGGTGIVHSWLEARQANRLTALKQAMVEQGMTADDIIRVIEAGKAKEETAANAQSS